jgi:hypothetical protein
VVYLIIIYDQLYPVLSHCLGEGSVWVRAPSPSPSPSLPFRDTPAAPSPSFLPSFLPSETGDPRAAAAAAARARS